MKCGVFRVGDLAQVCNGVVVGDPQTVVDGVASVEEATEGDIVYAERDKVLARALAGPASCVVVRRAPPDQRRTFIEVPNPRLAFARILHHMCPPRMPPPGIHPTAVVDPSAQVGPGVYVGPLCVVGEKAQVGEGSVLWGQCFVGPGVTMGPGCVLWPGVVLYPGVHLGARVVIHAGTVIGSDGFGYVPDEQGVYVKVLQVGTVVIGDDVEIGANSAVDRAALGRTVIGQGTKIDNLVQIGHNVVVGAHTVISGQAGIAGSSTIGSRCVLAGQVGIADHVTIEDGVVVGAQSGIATGKRIPKGEVVWGTPARPVEEAKRIVAALGRLGKDFRDRLGEEG